jgi:RNA polymerase sigma-70 factor (ECF subfamily)
MQTRQLGQISTAWSVVCRAHQGRQDDGAAARHALLERYSGAVYRYLLGALRDGDAADELSQEFCLRFLRGDFHRAAPERGRFRDFVKTSLVRLVSRYRQGQFKQPRPLAMDVPDRAALPVATDTTDDDFLRSWRSELMARAWESLEKIQEKTGQPYYQVLRLRVENPKMPSGRMAEQLGEHLGHSLTAAGVRQLLHRGRAMFADFLIEHVRNSLDNPTTEELEEELLNLELLVYCKPQIDVLTGRCKEVRLEALPTNSQECR